MSVKMMTWAWDVPDLDPSEKLVLMYLADCASPAGDSCFPLQATIAEKVNLTQRSVSNIVRSLISKKLIRSGPLYPDRPTDPKRAYILAGGSAWGVGKNFVPLTKPTSQGVSSPLRTPLIVTVNEPSMNHQQDVSASALPGLAGISLSNGQMSNGALNGKSVHARPTDDSDSDPGFREFWAAYPRKVGKWAAWKAWRKLKITAELKATILAAVKAHKESDPWTKDDGKFIPHPGTWLNNRRWEDEMQEANNGFDWRY